MEYEIIIQPENGLTCLYVKGKLIRYYRLEDLYNDLDLLITLLRAYDL